jgi:ketosteroid isomerase-like protein
MDTYDRNLALGDALRAAFAAQDRDLLATLLHENVVWTLPGDNAVSGDVSGIEGVFERFAALARYEVRISIEHVAVNSRGVALILHNTGSHQGRTLDEYLVSVVTIEDGKAASLDTYLTDIRGMNAYFC